MKIFLDTSSLFKFYHQEVGTDIFLRSLIEKENLPTEMLSL